MKFIAPLGSSKSYTMEFNSPRLPPWLVFTEFRETRPKADMGKESSVTMTPRTSGWYENPPKTHTHPHARTHWPHSNC